MESKISEKLGQLDTLLAKSKEGRTRVEGAKISIDEIFSEIDDLNNDIEICLDFLKENQGQLPSFNIPGLTNLLASLSTHVPELLKGFLNSGTSLSERLIETMDKLNVFITELEEKRERILKARISEELENISLGTPTSIDSKLLSDADALRRDWVETNVMSEDDNESFQQLCRHLSSQSSDS